MANATTSTKKKRSPRKPNPVGRPPGPPEQRRDQKLPVRFSQLDLERVRELAEAADLPVTEYCRRRLGLEG